jgi:hypothetical protein
MRMAREDCERLQRRQIPLAGYYARKDEFEDQRDRFYNRCAKVFKWEGWDSLGLDSDSDDLFIARMEILDAPLPREGFGGRRREIAAIERARVIAINLSSSPFEWLASHNKLEERIDQAGIGNIRFSAGIKLRDLMVGAEPSGLKSFNLEGSSGGGGVPVMISDFKLDCLRALTRIADEMRWMAPKRAFYKFVGEIDGKPWWVKQFEYPDLRKEPFKLLERVIYRDEWIFEGAGRRRQRAILNQLHWGLDAAALKFGMITPREFDARWAPQQGPGSPVPRNEQHQGSADRPQSQPASGATIPEDLAQQRT